ncbi:TPA_asm: M [Zanthoxylum betacytorhabdovirus 1]|nr:TPA_asm: M [Zanthoxilum betacytorhabdovirus 1]
MEGASKNSGSGASPPKRTIGRSQVENEEPLLKRRVDAPPASKQEGSSSSSSSKDPTKYLIVPNDELKINYCGVFSNFRGELVGKSKEELIDNYREILNECVKSHLTASSTAAVDNACDASIITAVLSHHVERQRVNDYIKPVLTHFLLGENVFKLTIDAPPMVILRLRYPIRFSVNREMDFKYNIAENEKFKYVLSGKGSVLIWKVSDEIVMDTYRVNPSVIIPGTIFNAPPDNILREIQDNPIDPSDVAESMSIKHLPEDQKVVSNIFSSLRSRK